MYDPNGRSSLAEQIGYPPADQPRDHPDYWVRPVTPMGPPKARGGLTIVQAADAQLDELLSA